MTKPETVQKGVFISIVPVPHDGPYLEVGDVVELCANSSTLCLFMLGLCFFFFFFGL